MSSKTNEQKTFHIFDPLLQQTLQLIRIRPRIKDLFRTIKVNREGLLDFTFHSKFKHSC